MKWLKKLFGKSGGLTQLNLPHAPDTAAFETPRPRAPGGPRTPKRVVILSDEEMALLDTVDLDPAQLAEMAERHAEGGLFKQAFQCCHLLAKSFPENPMTWRLCGVNLYNMDEAVWRRDNCGLFEGPYENAQRAVGYLDRALELDPGDHFAWYFKAHCLCHVGCITRHKALVQHGIECFFEALRTKPGDTATIRDRAKFQTVYDEWQF